jgi:hypothetical protein
MIRSFNVEAIKHHGTVKNVRTCPLAELSPSENIAKRLCIFKCFSFTSVEFLILRSHEHVFRYLLTGF